MKLLVTGREWSGLGSRDIDGKAGRPSERERTSQWDQWGNWQAWNIYGAGPDEILARHDWAGGNWIYKQDKQSSVVALLDGGGTVQEKYSYDAFGQPTVTD